jgi:hypothetical protein
VIGTTMKRGGLIPLALILIISLPVITQAQEQSRARSGRGMFAEFPDREPKAGEMAPDFTLKTLDDETFTLSEAYEQGPVVIEFGSFT